MTVVFIFQVVINRSFPTTFLATFCFCSDNLIFTYACCVTDKVFGPSCANQKVYEEGAKDVALSALRGMNGISMSSKKV